MVAHELAHVKNYDTLTMAVAATIGGAVSMLAQDLQFGALFGGNRENSGGIGWIGALVAMIVAPMAAALVQMAVSRSREYQADQLGGMISGNPLALASALQKIEGYAHQIRNEPAEAAPATAHLFIINPLTGEGMDNLFSTHPNTENRIAELEKLATELGAEPEDPAHRRCGHRVRRGGARPPAVGAPGGRPTAGSQLCRPTSDCLAQKRRYCAAQHEVHLPICGRLERVRGHDDRWRQPKGAGRPGAKLERYQDAVSAAERLLHLARAGVRKSVDTAGGLDAVQAAAHGLAWLATYVESLRQMLGWARRLEDAGRLMSELERLITVAAFGEYLAQIAGGIPMSQIETVRLPALGVPRAEIRRFEEQVGELIDAGTDDDLKARLPGRPCPQIFRTRHVLLPRRSEHPAAGADPLAGDQRPS